MSDRSYCFSQQRLLRLDERVFGDDMRLFGNVEITVHSGPDERLPVLQGPYLVEAFVTGPRTRVLRGSMGSEPFREPEPRDSMVLRYRNPLGLHWGRSFAGGR